MQLFPFTPTRNPELQVYSHLFNPHKLTNVRTVFAVNPSLSPAHKVASPGTAPEQEKVTGAAAEIVMVKGVEVVVLENVPLFAIKLEKVNVVVPTVVAVAVSVAKRRFAPSRSAPATAVISPYRLLPVTGAVPVAP